MSALSFSELPKDIEIKSIKNYTVVGHVLFGVKVEYNGEVYHVIWVDEYIHKHGNDIMCDFLPVPFQAWYTENTVCCRFYCYFKMYDFFSFYILN